MSLPFRIKNGRAGGLFIPAGAFCKPSISSMLRLIRDHTHQSQQPRLRTWSFARHWLALLAALCCSFVTRGICDVPLPQSVLNPATAVEAWNVIGMSARNVERLIGESRLSEIPQQISLCSPALRTLARVSIAGEQREAVSIETSRALGWVIAIAKSAAGADLPQTQSGFQGLQDSLKELARHFASQTVNADIFICPMHPDVSTPQKTGKCGKCGMGLIARRIPYSFIYTNPGEPTVVLSATASGPCEAGKKIDVKVRLSRKDSSPVIVNDLMVMHTEPIHLLIQDPTLSDYHHEHPVPTGTPGEYQFSFTPARTSSYRIWADLVPTATGIQELPYMDLPSAEAPKPVEDTATRLTSTVGGYQFTLTLMDGTGALVQARAMRKMSITVADAKGQPVTTLEPVMNAFAHLVGFYEDYQTVVHLHPSGGDILNPEARGGPALGFQFFPPKGGFIRLYCQVKIDGRMLFAPFNLNVASCSCCERVAGP